MKPKAPKRLQKAVRRDQLLETAQQIVASEGTDALTLGYFLHALRRHRWAAVARHFAALSGAQEMEGVQQELRDRYATIYQAAFAPRLLRPAGRIRTARPPPSSAGDGVYRARC